jgi:REP element-mobilizing transposase RayT
MFEFFDRKEGFVVTQGTLPHWYQPGVTYFVTFRCEDSVPQSLLRSWHLRRDDWLRQHAIDPTSPDWNVELRKHPEWEREYNRQFTREFMAYLDRGYGSCPLRDERAAALVAESLHHFDGDRYHLGDFIVMPNHVHLLCCLLGKVEIEKQCLSWKQYTGVRINKLLSRSGRFWQEESFDHLVRSPDHYESFQRYIADNPRKANLPAGHFRHWTRPK